jgi:hypothetical protein
MTQAESADQPAVGPDGQLLDASKIAWYNDPDDPHPIQSTSKVQEGALNFIMFPATTHFLVWLSWSMLLPNPCHGWYTTCRNYRS